MLSDSDYYIDFRYRSSSISDNRPISAKMFAIRYWSISITTSINIGIVRYSHRPIPMCYWGRFTFHKDLLMIHLAPGKALTISITTYVHNTFWTQSILSCKNTIYKWYSSGKKIHISPYRKVKEEEGHDTPLLADVAQGPWGHRQGNWKPPLDHVAQGALSNIYASG